MDAWWTFNHLNIIDRILSAFWQKNKSAGGKKKFFSKLPFTEHLIKTFLPCLCVATRNRVILASSETVNTELTKIKLCQLNKLLCSSNGTFLGNLNHSDKSGLILSLCHASFLPYLAHSHANLILLSLEMYEIFNITNSLLVYLFLLLFLT